MSRNFDELVTSTEHAEPLHPVRALFRNHFYLDGHVNREGGLGLAMLNALLLIPLVLAALFYPVAALTIAGVLVAISFVGYEGYVIWRRHHAKA